jgi:cation diffusion facilitator CzcD-associated flavoprotein CzcO
MVRVAVIGAGFGGIGVTAQLRQAGVTDITVFERGHDVGGVWRDNTYPGAACDVPSHLYSFSFAPEGRWSRRFAPQSEIHAYLRRTADELGVTPHVRFGAEVVRCVWSETRHHWVLTLATGEEHVAEVVVTACGQLSRPSVPDLPGIADFTGPVFHSAQWQHDIDLLGQRVLVVGTGASAIQFVPEIAKEAAEITVLQRSPAWVIPKPDRVYSARVQQVLKDHPVVLKADRLRTFLQNEARSLGFNTQPKLLKTFEVLARRNLHKQLPTAMHAAATPDYQIGCKRILVSNDWYAALAQPHVTVRTEAIDTVLPRGVRLADGTEVDADVIILGTGFTATELLVPMEVVGRDGETLAEAWSDGAEAYLGTAVAGFPNLFLVYGPNTNLGHNSIILMLESQIRWIVQAVERIRPGVALEVRPDVQATYNAWLQKRSARTVFAQGCDSWYLTASGRNTQNWPGSTVEFRLRTRRLRDSDVMITLPRLAAVPG